MSEVPFTSPPETLPQCHFPDPAAPPAGSAPDLSGWFRALEGARAPSAGASPVIPLGFGGPGSVDDAAWLGDKHLGIAVADVLVAHGVHGKEDLTRRHSALVSNANMARRMTEILPDHLVALLPPQAACAMQTHDCGTIVEACVHFVLKAGHGAVLTQLAEYLYSAGERDAVLPPAGDAAAPGRPETDPKNRLLHLDREATWTYDQVVPERSAPSLWTATLCTKGKQFIATAVGKKAASAATAVLALADMGVTASADPTRALALEERHRVARAATERLARTTSETGGKLLLSPVTFEARHLTSNLKDGETPLQWFERKGELHRLACAPVLFPLAVRAVHIWHAHVQEVGHLTVIIVVPVEREEAREWAPSVYVTPHPQESKNKAQQTACKAAQKYILALIDMLPCPDEAGSSSGVFAH